MMVDRSDESPVLLVEGALLVTEKGGPPVGGREGSLKAEEGIGLA